MSSVIVTFGSHWSIKGSPLWAIYVPGFCSALCFSILAVHLKIQIEMSWSDGEECCVRQFWELYPGLLWREARSGFFGENLSPVFIDILCVIKKLCEENQVLFCSALQGRFPPPQTWWVKTPSEKPRIGIKLSIWSSVWDEEIPICFSFSCTAVSMAVLGCWWFHFQLQYFFMVPI